MCKDEYDTARSDAIGWAIFKFFVPPKSKTLTFVSLEVLRIYAFESDLHWVFLSVVRLLLRQIFGDSNILNSPCAAYLPLFSLWYCCL